MKKLLILLVIVSGCLISCEKEDCKTCDVSTTKHDSLPVPSAKTLCGDELKNLKEYVYILDTETGDTITTIRTVCHKTSK